MHRRPLLFLSAALAAVIAGYFWIKSENTGVAPDYPPAPRKAALYGAAVEPPEESRPEELPPPLPRETPPERIAELREMLFSSPEVLAFQEEWKAGEKSRTRYISAKRSRGNQVIAVIAPVSSGEKPELQNSVSRLLAESFPGASKGERDMMRSELMNWIGPHEAERVVQIDFLSDSRNEFEVLNGRWFDVEDSAKIKDEFQYMDYGKILGHGRLEKERLLDRFGHLFTVQDEPGRNREDSPPPESSPDNAPP